MTQLMKKIIRKRKKRLNCRGQASFEYIGMLAMIILIQWQALPAFERFQQQMVQKISMQIYERLDAYAFFP